MERVRALYQITPSMTGPQMTGSQVTGLADLPAGQTECRRSDIWDLARALAFEQTVEVPEGLVTSAAILETIVGRVESVEELPGTPTQYLVGLSYAADLACENLAQLLNLVFGNISIHPGIGLKAIELPPSLLASFAGPRYGPAGLRALVGVFGRPLLATALKPRGSTVSELATIAREFALGGGDLVKDDHNLVESSLEMFRERVLRCRDAVEEANRQTGQRTLYLPNVSGPHGFLEQMFAFLETEGFRGLLIAPMLVGMETTRHLLESHELAAMAHPSFSGAFYQDRRHGIAREILLGTLFRLVGVDAVVYPNYGGRFSFTRDDCLAIRDRLQASLGHLRTALPVPAGGMGLENLALMADDYGVDAIFLIGGALLGRSEALRHSTELFRSRICEHFQVESS